MTKEHQLLKEAASLLEAVLHDQPDKHNIHHWLMEVGQLHPEPVTALSWEQAKDKILEKEGYRNYAHFNDNPERMHDDWDWHFKKISEAAHLFMEANRVSQWIPVEENSMPEIGVDVVVVIEHVTTKEKSRVILRLTQSDNYPWIFPDTQAVLSTKWTPILWQPLPVVPEIRKQ